MLDECPGMINLRCG
jgi:hypothetical protein